MPVYISDWPKCALKYKIIFSITRRSGSDVCYSLKEWALTFPMVSSISRIVKPRVKPITRMAKGPWKQKQKNNLFLALGFYPIGCIKTWAGWQSLYKQGLPCWL